jgi:hypothetical protein
MKKKAAKQLLMTMQEIKSDIIKLDEQWQEKELNFLIFGHLPTKKRTILVVAVLLGLLILGTIGQVYNYFYIENRMAHSLIRLFFGFFMAVGFVGTVLIIGNYNNYKKFKQNYEDKHTALTKQLKP